jgi:cyclopropane fatty-acyl-phospholipid synthase-like methyltransferase
VDGAAAMLGFGREAVRRAGLERRIRLIKAYLPGVNWAADRYDAVISNSLLHHLADPGVLWETIKDCGKPGASVFVMDLLRPESPERAEALVQRYAANEPEVLRRDFFNSLCAAYTVEEIRAQLEAAGLPELEIRAVSDRHVVVVGQIDQSV